MSFPYRFLQDDQENTWLDVDGGTTLPARAVGGRPAWAASDLAPLLGLTHGQRSLAAIVQMTRRTEYVRDVDYGWAQGLVFYQSGIDLLFMQAGNDLGRRTRRAIVAGLARQPVDEVLAQILPDVQIRRVVVS